MVTLIKVEPVEPGEDIELRQIDFQIGCFMRGEEAVVAIAMGMGPDDDPSPTRVYPAAMMGNWGDVASVIGSLIGAATQMWGPPTMDVLLPFPPSKPPTEH